MKTIVFSSSCAEINPDDKCIDLSGKKACRNTSKLVEDNLIDLTVLYEKHGKEWSDNFSKWFGELNKRNADILWWAHTSTAKNILSSPIGERLFQVFAVCDVARYEAEGILYVLGATPAQMKSISVILLNNKVQITGNAWKARRWTTMLESAKALLRIPVQCMQIWLGFFNNIKPNNIKPNDVCIFTYLDRDHIEGVDNYFGKLLEALNKNNHISTIHYLTYIYKPYRKRMRQLSATNDASSYLALFGLLKLKDYLWALTVSICEWFRVTFSIIQIYKLGNEHEALLREIFIHDIAVGGYIHNLLAYRAFCNYLSKYKPRVLIYPYENKSIEKMLLLGVDGADNQAMTIGYQHTSITPRHLTLFFQPGEAIKTPLPNKIITVGNITKNYLDINGNYPPEIFTTGCALRQIWDKPYARKNTNKTTIRVLLALSSSKNELIESLKYFRKVMKSIPNLELGVRPHCNFPLSVLHKELADWTSKATTDFSNSLLEDNLEWCTVTAYVSSTVALESLMRGKPVVNFSIGDIVSPDPLIGEVPFHWVAEDYYKMIDLLRYVNEIPDSKYEHYKKGAITYIHDYFLPIDHKCLEKLVGNRM